MTVAGHGQARAGPPPVLHGQTTSAVFYKALVSERSVSGDGHTMGLFLVLLILTLGRTISFSLPNRLPFRKFEFDEETGICREPPAFICNGGSPDGNSPDEAAQYFVLRNVPGDGDCVFHAGTTTQRTVWGPSVFISLTRWLVIRYLVLSSVFITSKPVLCICAAKCCADPRTLPQRRMKLH